VDISIKTRLTPDMIKPIEAADTPLARYVAHFYQAGQGGEYMWDELAAAAWLDPSLITKRETRYMSVDLNRGAGYGNTLTWTDQDKPRTESARPVEIQVDLDNERFDNMFVGLMTSPTPRPVGH
jgi:inosine-uridine nucleoside N-ribohydrolase